MSDLLPIIEQLADCQTHAERADWLFRCPNWIFYREHMALRRILQRAGLLPAVAYVEAKLAEQSATRLPSGHLPSTILAAVYLAETDLKISAREIGKR
ncbi:hypothetical protein LJR251_002733 [Rhizobium rhizogenes]|uniref:hypothetical protein n=1 Tax=Rhizobium rhizogenes TaxID=359 RepID=UPI003ECCD35D